MWQGKINKTLYLVGIFVGAWVEIAKANWDEATGYLHDYKPSQAWLSANKRKQPQICFLARFSPGLMYPLLFANLSCLRLSQAMLEQYPNCRM